MNYITSATTTLANTAFTIPALTTDLITSITSAIVSPGLKYITPVVHKIYETCIKNTYGDKILMWSKTHVLNACKFSIQGIPVIKTLVGCIAIAILCHYVRKTYVYLTTQTLEGAALVNTIESFYNRFDTKKSLMWITLVTSSIVALGAGATKIGL